MSVWVKENYPDAIWVPNDNPHAASAYERSVARLALRDQVGTKFAYDIGGRPDAFPNCHACCPVVGPEDHHRQARYTDFENWCTHLDSDCDCVPLFDVVTSCHSLYHLTPAAWAKRVEQSRAKTGYAIVHMFDQISDSWYGGEYNYTRDGSNVTCHVRGNLCAYSHPAADWLRAGYWSDGVTAMAWQVEKAFKHCVLLSFTPAKVGLNAGVPARSFEGSLRDERDYGSVTLETTRKTYVSTLVQVDMRSADAYSCGGWLAIIGIVGERKVIIPKALYNRASIAALGVQRTTETWTAHLNSVKGMARDYVLPGDPALTVLFTAAISFASNVRQETAVMEGLRWHARAYAAWATARQRIAVPRRRWWIAIAAVCMLMLTGAEAMTLGVAPATHPGLWVWLLNVPPVALICWIVNRRAGVLSGIQARAVILAARLHPPIGRYVQPVDAPVPLPAHESEKAVRNPRDGATVVEQLLTAPVRASGGGVVVGVQLLASVPVVTAVSPGNELRAVSNRATMEVPLPNDWEWQIFEDWVWASFDTIFPKVKDVIPLSFETWVVRFPPAKQKRLRAANERLQGRPELYDDPRTYIISAFDKRELLLRSQSGEFEDYDPRLIQGFTDEYNCITGPWTVAFSDRIAKMWNSDHFIYYPCHDSAETVGEWLVHEYFDGEVIVEGDESRYDAHLHRRALRLLAAIRKRFNPPPEVRRAFKRVDGKKRGFALYVAYVVEATRASGDVRTSIDNSILKGLMCLFSACRNHGYNCKIPYRGGLAATLPLAHHAQQAGVRAVIKGDDSVMRMGRWSMVQQDLFRPLSLRLGFELEPKFHTDLDFVTFCSGRFWPCGDGRIWGPMPGRAISKMAMTLSNPKNHLAHVRGVAECYLHDSSYVPFLRAWIQMLLRLTSKVRADSQRVWRFQARSDHVPSARLAEMVNKVYGLDLASTELSLQELCDEVFSLPSLVNDPALETLVKVDMA